VDHVAGLVDDAGLDHALVDIKAHVTYHDDRHGSFSCVTARPGANARASGRRQKFGPRVRVLTSAGVGPKRQLPLRARSSTGWAGRALRYDSGLMAHRCSRAAPKCPGPPVLLVLDWGWKDLMISLRRHFVPNPVQVNYCSRLGTRRRRPLFIHTWYNHKVNPLTAIQEHFMIMEAIRNGVWEERIAKTLDVDVAAIRRKRDLLEGICPEAVQLLKEKRRPTAPSARC